MIDFCSEDYRRDQCLPRHTDDCAYVDPVPENFFLTTHKEREVAFDLADDLFKWLLRINDDDFGPLSTTVSYPHSTYDYLSLTLDTLFRQLGVPPEDIPQVRDLMGGGSPAEEAIEVVRSEKN